MKKETPYASQLKRLLSKRRRRETSSSIDYTLTRGRCIALERGERKTNGFIYGKD